MDVRFISVNGGLQDLVGEDGILVRRMNILLPLLR